VAKNKIDDLRDHLFETIESLKDPEKPMDLDRARAIAGVAQTIINSAKVEVELANAVNGLPGSSFWPMMKPARFKIDQLVVGDVVVQNEAGRWRAQIDRLDIVPAEGEVKIWATIIESGLHTAFAIWPTNLHLFRVERKGTCDKPCCYRCRRNVATDVDYCMDHWDLQAGDDTRVAAGDRARVLERRAQEQRSLFE
jgi:hypothetical protein